MGAKKFLSVGGVAAAGLLRGWGWDFGLVGGGVPIRNHKYIYARRRRSFHILPVFFLVTNCLRENEASLASVGNQQSPPVGGCN